MGRGVTKAENCLSTAFLETPPAGRCGSGSLTGVNCWLAPATAAVGITGRVLAADRLVVGQFQAVERAGPASATPWCAIASCASPPAKPRHKVPAPQANGVAARLRPPPEARAREGALDMTTPHPQSLSPLRGRLGEREASGDAASWIGDVGSGVTY